ncbi:hypothetical protein N7462_000444 [Penicillium macrosclerotiorum]|uniref:uncharacterized protein n=1 Tax=Penicillium macrosclerotiorum TaxID=303699 RepID=UPI002547E4EA|nr:uncharacterized protein N7462_000444 [Penicillium macrosclerotiorum]KAJ5698439.1 hypothetical protein N7462_000444 [Penicillium macrosclerotiorum]
MVQPLYSSTRGSSPCGGGITSELKQASLHPWGMIDWYLFLSTIEKDQEWESLIFDSQMLEMYGTRSQSFRVLSLSKDDDNYYDNEPAWEQPIIVFSSLPLPCSHSDQECSLVLAFDLTNASLLAFLFPSAPQTLDTLRSVWDEGELVINVPLARFQAVLDYTMAGHPQTLWIGVFNYFRESTREFPAGLDLLLVIQFVQFVNDYTEFLAALDIKLPACLRSHELGLRALLCRASQEAWIATRDGLSASQFLERKVGELLGSEMLPIQAPALFCPGVGQEGTQTTDALAMRQWVRVLGSVLGLPAQAVQTLEVVGLATLNTVLVLTIVCSLWAQGHAELPLP